MFNPINKFGFRLVTIVFACLLLFSMASPAQQKMDNIGKQQVMQMLKNVKNAIIKDYYDPTFGGRDVEARFKLAEEKLKGVETLGQAYAIVAQAVVDLNDSHTRFFPPARPMITEYGWRMKVVGQKVFISGIKEKSDADLKGLKVGDEVLKINGFKPTRSEMWKMLYYYQVISPQPKLNFEVMSTDGVAKQITVETKFTTLKRIVDLNNTHDLNESVREGERLDVLDKHYFKEVGDTLIWKMPTFVFDPNEVDGFMKRTEEKKNLILDLRGNGGGYVVTLERLAGYFFEKDTKIADLKGRKKMDPQMAKHRSSNFFSGRVIVLVDSESASAAEIFARLMQIEKRGRVVGDISSGMVMQSRGVSMDAGVSTVISYGLNLTNADVIMTDGKSLEHVGVQPDELVILTGKDLSDRNDPVLARALELCGQKIDPGTAGKYFPVEPFIERKTNIAISMEN